jgi:glycosyltransferase involved in cell wall biosynthesis
LAERLGRRHEVTLLMRTLEPVPPGEFLGCRVEPIWVPSDLPIHLQLPLFARGVAKVARRVVASGQVELFEGPSGHGPLGYYAARRTAPVVTRLITSAAQWTRLRRFHPLRRLVRKVSFAAILRLEAACLRHCDLIITPTQVELEDQRRYAVFDAPVELCPYGWDLEACHDPAQARARLVARYGIAPDQPIVLAVGRLEHRKGTDFLLNAAGALHPQFPRAVFVLIGGDNWPGGKAALIAQTLGEVPDWVRFLGVCTEEEKRDWLAACDVVCFPSRWESFGLVLLEAMANRKPAVCFNIGGPVEIAHANPGILAVPPFDQEQLNAALAGLLADPARRRALGEKGRRVAEERYSLDRFVARTEEIYAIALDRWRSRSAGQP